MKLSVHKSFEVYVCSCYVVVVITISPITKSNRFFEIQTHKSNSLLIISPPWLNTSFCKCRFTMHSISALSRKAKDTINFTASMRHHFSSMQRQHKIPPITEIIIFFIVLINSKIRENISSWPVIITEITEPNDFYENSSSRSNRTVLCTLRIS